PATPSPPPRLTRRTDCVPTVGSVHSAHVEPQAAGVWVLPWGLLTGGLLTLVFLGQMNGKPLSGCGQTSSSPYRPFSLRGGCSTIHERSPLRSLAGAPA